MVDDDRAGTIEQRAVAVAMVVAALMIAQQIAGKAARDAYFLSNYSVSKLPVVMVAAALLSVGVVLLVSKVMRRGSPARTVPWIFLANACLFAGEFGLSHLAPGPTAIIVYLHMAGLGAAAISTFWSVVSERFDPHRAKVAIARIAIGATFGGVVGGLAAWQLSKFVSIPFLFLGLGAANLLCAAGIVLIGGSQSTVPTTDDPRSGFGVLKETPYLRQLAILVTLAAFAEVVIDYVFKASAQAEYTSPGELVTFFALFYTAAGVLTFVLQTTLVGRTLRAVGLTATVAMRPAVFVGGGLLALVFPQLWAAAAMAGASQTVENSFYRSGYEILYTPLTPSKKRPTKTIIDVGFEKLGVAVGSGFVLLLIAVVPAHSYNSLLGLAVALGVLTLIVCARLHSGYVDALADSLRAGEVVMDEGELRDRTTLRTFSDTATALNRDELLREIAAFRESRGESELTTSDADSGLDPILTAISDLRSGDPDRIERVLGSASDPDPRLVTHIIPILSKKRFEKNATRQLRRIAADHIGQLTDAILSADLAVPARRRVAGILGSVPSQRAVDGLLQGLRSPLFSVRDRCGAALLKALEGDADLRVPADPIFESIRAEAGTSDATAASHRLSHITNLLSLVLDRDVIQLASRALKTTDVGLRGTGLEYLENVVPPRTFTALRPLLRTSAHLKAKKRPRSKKQVVDDLLASVDTSGIDVAAIRAQLSAKTDG